MHSQRQYLEYEKRYTYIVISGYFDAVWYQPRHQPTSWSNESDKCKLLNILLQICLQDAHWPIKGKVLRMREMLRASWFSIFLLLASSLDDAFAGQQKVVPTVAPSQNSSPSSITTSLMPSSKTTTSSRPSVNRFSSQKPTAFANPAPISEPLSSQPSQNPKVPGSMTPTIAPTNMVMTSVPVDLTLTTSPLSVPIISPFASSMPTISSSSPSPVPFGVASINPTLSYQPSSLEPSVSPMPYLRTYVFLSISLPYMSSFYLLDITDCYPSCTGNFNKSIAFNTVSPYWESICIS